MKDIEHDLDGIVTQMDGSTVTKSFVTLKQSRKLMSHVYKTCNKYMLLLKTERAFSLLLYTYEVQMSECLSYGRKCSF